jgi:hypothetical protein
MKKIFISYRRVPDQYVAGNLGRELRSRFGDSQVFRDKEDIQGGVSWRQHVLDEINRDSVLLVLIGKDWSSARDSKGNRRLDNPDDPIRLEIADAIRDNATLIPLLLENAEMPAASELPHDLTTMSEINALKLRDGDWESDVAKISRRLEALGFKPVHTPEPERTATKRSAKAIWSLGILALVIIGLAAEEKDSETWLGALALSLAALVLAGFAYYDIRQKKATGKGLAIGGLITSALIALGALGNLTQPNSLTEVAKIDSSAPPPNSPPPSAPSVSEPPPAPPSAPPAVANAPASSNQPAPPPVSASALADSVATTKLPTPRPLNVAGQWRDEEEGTLVLFTQDGNNVHFVATEAGIAVEGRGTIQGRDIAMTLYMANIPIGESNMKVANERRIQGSMIVNGETSHFAFVR